MPEEDKSVDFAGLIDGYTKSERYDQTEEDKELSARLKEWFIPSVLRARLGAVPSLSKR